MSEMIERVARAIYEDRNGTGCRPWSRHSESYKNLYRSDARAAIEAMRKPTEDMETAGYGGNHFGDHDPLGSWSRMIDAALK